MTYPTHFINGLYWYYMKNPNSSPIRINLRMTTSFDHLCP